MMVSISLRWLSPKLSAATANGAPQRASASRAGAMKRGIGNPLDESRLSKAVIGGVRAGVARFFVFGSGAASVDSKVAIRRAQWLRSVLRARQWLGGHDIVGLDPSRCADGKAGFRP